jgi:hypothetical protein
MVSYVLYEEILMSEEKSLSSGLKAREEKNVKVISKEPIPTLLVDGFQGAGLTNGVLRINLFEEKYDTATDSVEKHIIARLAIPVESFISFVDVLNSINNDLKGTILAEMQKHVEEKVESSENE